LIHREPSDRTCKGSCGLPRDRERENQCRHALAVLGELVLELDAASP
jgi:hypothetical protein